MDDLTAKIGEINARAGTLYNAYQFKKALSLYEGSRELSEHLKPDNPLRAIVLHNLGVCKSQVSVGLYAEGESALLEALRIRRMKSSTKTDVAQTLTVLGKCLRLQKKYVEGEEALKQARDIQEMTLAKDSNDMATKPEGRYLNNEDRPDITAFNINSGVNFDLDISMAHPFSKDIVKRSSEETALHEMGVCLTEQKKYGEAIPLLQQSLEIYKKTVGPQHPNTAAASCWLGVCKGHLEEYNECFKFLNEALSIRRSAFSPSRIEIAWVLYWRGLFLNRLSKSKKAEADLKEANDIALRNELTPDHDLRNNIERELHVSRKCKDKQKRLSQQNIVFSPGASHVSVDTGKLKHFSDSSDYLRSISHDAPSLTQPLLTASRPRSASWHAGCSPNTNFFAKLSSQQLKQYFISPATDQPLNEHDKSQTLPLPKTASHMEFGHILPDPHWFGGTLEMVVLQKVTPFTAVIGPVGGECRSSDITLTVPPGAVSTETLFSIDIHLNSKFAPPITNRESVLLSPLIHLSPSRVEFNKPVLLSFPSFVGSVATQSDWNLELKMSDSSTNKYPGNWYTALEFNTGTRQVIPRSSSVQFDAETGVLFLNHFCWLCWLGQVLGLPSLASRSICYAVFGKQLHSYKWTISTHIIHGSNYVHSELVQSLKEQGYVSLTPPTPAVVGLCGQVKLEVECDDPWVLCMGPAEAHIPTKRIWRSPVNGASYFTVTVRDPSESMECLECRITASFSGEWMDNGDLVMLLVSHPLETQRPRLALNREAFLSCPTFSGESSRSCSPACTPTPSVITVNRNNFTFNHSKGLAFGSNAHISLEQLGLPDVEVGAAEFELPKVKLIGDSDDIAESFGEVSLSEACEIDPDYILVGVETLLTVHLCSEESEESDLSVPEDGSLVQFISCGEKDAKFEERKGTRVGNKVLTVVSPGWPFGDRLLVRVLTLSKKQIATTFIDVEDFF